MSLSKGIQSAAAAALSAAMLIAVAACGTTDSTDTASKSGDSSKDSSSTSIQGFDTSSIQKDDEIAALLPDSVAGDGTLTVGTDTSYAPAEFLAEDGKTPVGFDVDLSKALAAVFGLKENTVSSTFDSIIPSVGSKYDIGISSFTVTKERMEAVDFVTYFKAGSTFVVQKGNPNKVDSSNLCGVKVAVQTGTTQEEEVNKDNEQCKADGKDAIDIQSSKLQTDVTTAVASGKASIFYADSTVSAYAIKQTGDTLETLGEDAGGVPGGRGHQEGRYQDRRSRAEGHPEADGRRHLQEDPRHVGRLFRRRRQGRDQPVRRVVSVTMKTPVALRRESFCICMHCSV